MADHEIIETNQLTKGAVECICILKQKGQMQFIKNGSQDFK